MSQEKENGFFEYMKDVLENRIESPFLVAFMFSWLIVNRGFVFLILFYDGSDKYQLLSNWSFSETINFFEVSFETNTYKTIVLPFFYAFFISIFTNPLSLMVSAFRYDISAGFKSKATDSKIVYETAHQLKMMNSRLEQSKNELEVVSKSLEENRSLAKELEDQTVKAKRYVDLIRIDEVFQFMMKAERYRDIALMENYVEVQSSEFHYNCKVIECIFENNRIEKLDVLSFITKICDFDFDLALHIAKGGTIKSYSEVGFGSKFKVQSIVSYMKKEESL